MAPRQARSQATAQSIAAHVKKHARNIKRTLRHRHASSSATIREAEYKGHHIEVQTIYKIHVDGKPVTGHLAVTNDGRVHYHPVPNASFISAIDLVKRLIDMFPDDFARRGEKMEDEHKHRRLRRSVRQSSTSQRRTRPRR